MQASVDEYVRALASIIDQNPNAIGFALAINGKISGVDVYGSAGLFRKTWLKSLKSSAVEAIADQNNKKFKQPAVSDVLAFMKEADDAHASQKQVSPRFTQLTKESTHNVSFETKDSKANATLHRSYIRK